MAAKSAAVKLTLRITSFILRVLLNIIFYILVVILIINVSKAAYKFTYQLYGPDTVDSPPGREIIIQIKKGESSMDIASKLEQNRAIENKYSFFVKTKLQKSSIMPGTYVISSSMTYNEILGIITDYSKSIVKEEAEDAPKNEEADAPKENAADEGLKEDGANDGE